MKQLTERENILRVYRGELPVWVPIQEHACQVFFGPSFLTGWGMRTDVKSGDRVKDMFGSEYLVSAPGICPVPVTDHYTITDITRWREEFPVENFPDLDAYDWKEYARRDTGDWDRENHYTKILIGGAGTGTTFEWLASLMGTENAMLALMAEPEAVEDLFNEMTVFQEELISRVAHYYKPDSIIISDDVAFSRGMFISPATYRKSIKPHHQRLLKRIADCCCVPEMHCCGKAELIAEDFAEMGARCWNPAQIVNDLEGVKARLGNRLLLEGAWDSVGAPGKAGASEKCVRGAVRSAIDRCAANGGFVFSTSGMTRECDVGKEHIFWIFDEAVKYGAAFYRR